MKDNNLLGNETLAKLKNNTLNNKTLKYVTPFLDVEDISRTKLLSKSPNKAFSKMALRMIDYMKNPYETKFNKIIADENYYGEYADADIRERFEVFASLRSIENFNAIFKKADTYNPNEKNDLSYNANNKINYQKNIIPKMTLEAEDGRMLFFSMIDNNFRELLIESLKTNPTLKQYLTRRLLENSDIFNEINEMINNIKNIPEGALENIVTTDMMAGLVGGHILPVQNFIKGYLEELIRQQNQNKQDITEEQYIKKITTENTKDTKDLFDQERLCCTIKPKLN